MNTEGQKLRFNIRSVAVTMGATVILLAIVLASSVYEFNNNLGQIVFDRSYKNIMQTAQLQKISFIGHLNSQFAALNRTADFIIKSGQTDHATITNILQSEVKASSFLEMGFVDRSGKVYTDKGEVKPIDQPHFYARAVGGERFVSSPILSQNGSTYHYLMVPIYSRDDTVGVLYGTFPTDKLTEALNRNDFNDVCGSIIVTDNASVIASVGSAAFLQTDFNVSDYFREGELEDTSFEQLENNLLIGKKGFFKFKNGFESKYVVYQSLGISNWRLITLLPQRVVDYEATVISDGVVDFVTKIGLIFMALIGIQMMWVFRSSWLIEKTMLNSQRANKEYEALIENIRGGVLTIECGTEMKLLFASAGFERLTGYSLADMNALFGGSYLSIVDTQDRKRLTAVYKNTCLERAIGSCEYRVNCKDKKIKWVLMNWSVVENPSSAISAHCVLTDITESREERERLKIAQERYKIVLGQTESLILEYNFLDNTYFTNSPDGKLFGYELDGGLLYNEFITKNIVFKEDVDIFREMFVRLFGGEKQVEVFVRFNVRDVGTRWHRLTFTSITNSRGIVIRAIGRINDIDSQKRESDMLREKAIRDSLTGAYNKTSTASMINEALKQDRKNAFSAMLVMDIDNFKTVNDKLGHLMGDDLLFEFSKIIKENIGEDDIFGRVGGDEFVVLLRGLDSQRFAMNRAKSLWARINRFSLPSNPEVEIGVSVGASVAPLDGTTYQELFEKADKALLEIKAAEKGNIGFGSEQFGTTRIL